MPSDLRPGVERILRQLLVAGLPILGAAACGDGTRIMTEGSGGTTGTGGGTGGATTGGQGGSATGGSKTGGSTTGGSTTGGSTTGGRGGAATGGATTGGQGGTGAGGQGVCSLVDVGCGFVPTCGTGGGAGISLPINSATLSFDPTDPRWASLYEPCARENTCGDSCSQFCQAVLKASAATLGIGSSTYYGCKIDCADPGKITLRYAGGVCGRRVCDGEERGGLSAQNDVPRSLGAYLAGAARLEAESVPAFGRLWRALRDHHAPDELVRAARVAMAEEARHWRRTRDLARKHGASAVRPKITATPFASLEELALENVVEGCVRETYGAMVAAHQAREAEDEGVRALMIDVAHEELGHAALSWKIDAWARSQLGPDFLARREQAALTAMAELAADVEQPHDPAVHSAAGLPEVAESEELLAVAWTHLWAPQLTARA